MATLADIFGGDGFTTYELTSAIQKVPAAPTTIERLGIFRDVPITGTLVAVEESDGMLALVPTTKRGGPGIPSQDPKRTVRSFVVPHIQLDDVVHADDVLNVRTFGGGGNMGGVGEVVGRKFETMKRSIDVTNEYLRLGALMGIVTYPTNSVDAALNLFTEFGTSIQTITFELDVATTQVVQSIIPSVQDAVETALGGTPYDYIHVLCGRTFFRNLIGHAMVRELYTHQQAMFDLGKVDRPDSRQGRIFKVGGMVFEEFYGVVSGVTMMTATDGRAFPVGPDIYHSYLAPADIVEAVGTLGQAVYARQYPAKDGKSQILESQKNVLNLCLRPRALIRLTNT